MIRCRRSMKRRVCLSISMPFSPYARQKANPYPPYFSSHQPQRLQIHLRPHNHLPPLGRHQRPALLPPILVRQEPSLLDPARLGAWICGVVACVSEGADGKCEYSNVGGCVCDGGAACGGCGGGGDGAWGRVGEEGWEGGDGGDGRGEGGEEGALIEGEKSVHEMRYGGNRGIGCCFSFY